METGTQFTLKKNGKEKERGFAPRSRYARARTPRESTEGQLLLVVSVARDSCGGEGASNDNSRVNQKDMGHPARPRARPPAGSARHGCGGGWDTGATAQRSPGCSEAAERSRGRASPLCGDAGRPEARRAAPTAPAAGAGEVGKRASTPSPCCCPQRHSPR